MKRTTWAAALAICAALAQPAFLGSPTLAAAQGPVVSAADGPVAGITTDGADKFLGVPFAAPPVGPLRWKPPQAPAHWTEAGDASRHATRCSAPSAGDGPRLINEDCLYLDVYRPAGAAAGARLPVTVYIHGGGNYSGSTDIYDGSRMAAEGQTVVVTPAYRLGAFGFLSLPGLTAEDPVAGSGDYALLDQIKALQWVRDNIAQFGGDPADVTVTGQSSGGTNVCSLLATPSANGLYKRAVIQSLRLPGEPGPGDEREARDFPGEDAGLRRSRHGRRMPAGQARGGHSRRLGRTHHRGGLWNRAAAALADAGFGDRRPSTRRRC